MGSIKQALKPRIPILDNPMNTQAIYNPCYHPFVAGDLAKLGYNRKEMAAVFGVSIPCIYSWYNKYPEFKAKVEEKEGELISKIGMKLYDIALNGSGKEQVQACIFLLKSRAGWGDKLKIEVENITPEKMDDAALMKYAQEVIQKQQQLKQIENTLDNETIIEDQVNSNDTQ